MGFFEKTLILTMVIMTGMAVGWFFCWYFKIKPLKKQNDSKPIETFYLPIPGWGGKDVVCRKSEWPASSEEYLNFHSLDREDGIIEITFDGLERHLDHYAVYLTTRQKRDFIRLLKEKRSTEEILKKINI